MITGKTLIAWGYKPGPWFAAAIAAAEKARAAGADEAAIRAVVDGFAPAPEPAVEPWRCARAATSPIRSTSAPRSRRTPTTSPPSSATWPT